MKKEKQYPVDVFSDVLKLKIDLVNDRIKAHRAPHRKVVEEIVKSLCLLDEPGDLELIEDLIVKFLINKREVYERQLTTGKI